jgi:hypothetical protein
MTWIFRILWWLLITLGSSVYCACAGFREVVEVPREDRLVTLTLDEAHTTTPAESLPPLGNPVSSMTWACGAMNSMAQHAILRRTSV